MHGQTKKLMTRKQRNWHRNSKRTSKSSVLSHRKLLHSADHFKNKHMLKNRSEKSERFFCLDSVKSFFFLFTHPLADCLYCLAICCRRKKVCIVRKVPGFVRLPIKLQCF